MKESDLSVALPYNKQMVGRKLELSQNEADSKATTAAAAAAAASGATGCAKYVIRYRECMKNHAATLGGHANDGCGEFMPGGTDDGLNCAACGCHRNFHRKEVVEDLKSRMINIPPPQTPLPMSMVYNAILPSHKCKGLIEGLPGLQPLPSLSLQPLQSSPVLPAMPMNHRSMFGVVDVKESTNNNVDGESGEVMVKDKKKRFRTKFTQEQKDKMMEFAERSEWKIQKHDDSTLNRFCSDVGVKPEVMKVWMHNNKHAMKMRKRETAIVPAEPTGAAMTQTSSSGSPSPSGSGSPPSVMGLGTDSL